TLKMPAFEWVHVQLHQQKGMISLSPPTICNSAKTHKEALKEAGLKWAHARKLWIYVGTECRGRGNKDMDELRAKYGNEKVKTRSKIKKIA
ncbi:hypothetical protein ACMZ5C_20155, partial [Acinetobacter baumannii]